MSPAAVGVGNVPGEVDQREAEELENSRKKKVTVFAVSFGFLLSRTQNFAISFTLVGFFFYLTDLSAGKFPSLSACFSNSRADISLILFNSLLKIL